MSNFTSISFSHVYRGNNKKIDLLSKQVVDLHMDLVDVTKHKDGATFLFRWVDYVLTHFKTFFYESGINIP